MVMAMAKTPSARVSRRSNALVLPLSAKPTSSCQPLLNLYTTSGHDPHSRPHASIVKAHDGAGENAYALRRGAYRVMDWSRVKNFKEGAICESGRHTINGLYTLNRETQLGATRRIGRFVRGKIVQSAWVLYGLPSALRHYWAGDDVLSLVSIDVREQGRNSRAVGSRWTERSALGVASD